MTAEAGRAPTYYRWSRDRPCTTNGIYGWTLRGNAGTESTTVTDLKTSRKLKSNASEGKDDPRLLSLSNADVTSSIRSKRGCPICLYPPSSINHFNINRGYVMGYVPIAKKMHHGGGPVGYNVRRIVSAPPSFEYQEGRGKDICLWHSLSGTLVHCKNYEAPEETF